MKCVRWQSEQGMRLPIWHNHVNLCVVSHAAPNYYAVLGVAPDADRRAIRARYVALMQHNRLHPDLGGAHDVAARVTEAYSVLRDPVRRALYDQLCTRAAALPTPAASPVAAERRRRLRLAYQGLLALCVAGKTSTVAQSRDVSASGCAFRTICPLTVGDPITLCFDAVPTTEIAATVQWVRKHPQRFGPMLYEVGAEFALPADGLVEQLMSV